MRKNKEPKIKLGQKFGRLTTTKLIGQDKYYIYMWECLCECGNNTIVKTGHLMSGATKSCGCLNTDVLRKRNRRPKGQAGFNKAKSNYKKGAQYRGIVFDLTDEDLKIIFKLNCAYCGQIPKLISYGTNNKSPEAIEHCQYIHNGIDRVDSNLGYIRDNVVPCCTICNTMKWSMTYEEFFDHIEKVYKFHKKYYTLIKGTKFCG
jgi:5-methylcytosine-specific restriction endonuclease McrA